VCWSPIRRSITPYGQDGPLAGVAGSDLEVTAASGSLWLAGEEGRAPVRTAQPQSPYWSGMYGAMGALVALRSPVAQRVDVSAQAAMTTVHPPAPVWWDIAGEEHGRTGPFLLGRSNVGSRFRNIWQCADGFVSFAIQGGPIGRHTGRMLAEWMRERGAPTGAIAAIDWDRFDNTTLTQPQVDLLEVAIAPFLRSLTKADMPGNDALPRIEVEPDTFTVRIDGEDEQKIDEDNADRLINRRPVARELAVVVAFFRRTPAGEDAAVVLVARDERRRLEVEAFDDGDVALEGHERLQRLAEIVAGPQHALEHLGQPRPRDRLRLAVAPRERDVLEAALVRDVELDRVAEHRVGELA